MFVLAKMSAGDITEIVVFSINILVLIVNVVLYFLSKKNKKKAEEYAEEAKNAKIETQQYLETMRIELDRK